MDMKKNRVPGKCKGPEVGACLSCSKKAKKPAWVTQSEGIREVIKSREKPGSRVCVALEAMNNGSLGMRSCVRGDKNCDKECISNLLLEELLVN